jgi:hypothetical protein
MIDSRQFRKIEKRVVDLKLAKLGFAPRMCKWGGRLFVRKRENQLHGIRVDLHWPTFRVQYHWHYEFIPSVADETVSDRLDADHPFDEPDFVVVNDAETDSPWGRRISDDEPEVTACLHEAIDLALQALDELARRFAEPGELLRLFPPRVFRYRVYDIDGSDPKVRDVGRALLSWISPGIGLNPWLLMPFLQLLARHLGNDALAKEYAQVHLDLTQWFRLVRSKKLDVDERFLPVISPTTPGSEPLAEETA